MYGTVALSEVADTNMARCLRLGVMISVAQELPGAVEIANSNQDIAGAVEDVRAYKHTEVISKFLHLLVAAERQQRDTINH